LNGIDFTSLAYDQQKKLYMGRTSDGATVSISSQGELIAAQSRGRSVPNFGTPATAVNAPQLPLAKEAATRTAVCDPFRGRKARACARGA